MAQKESQDYKITAEQLAEFIKLLAQRREKEAKKREQAPVHGIKDRVFISLFSEVENQIELYSALHPDEPAPTADEIVLVTLESVVSNHPYNDLGLLVRGRMLILIEAQSKWSANIVLRALMYLTGTWNDLLSCSNANLYGTKAVSLPEFESYVVFTGKRAHKAEWLSFRDIYFPDRECSLDFKVHCIYKIDGGRDIIQQYIAFANLWDEQSHLFDKDHQMDALRKTIEICLERGILKKFLIKRRAEIMDIYTALFDQDEVTRRVIVEHERNAEKKEKIKIAKSLKAKGIPSTVIAQCTGLTLEQIEKL